MRSASFVARLVLIAAVAACVPLSPASLERPGVPSIIPPSRSTYADDDWITFAHDYLRSGFQAEEVGLSRSNVKSLKLRWKTRVARGGMYASPLVYNGNVIVVTLTGVSRGATVYDLRASDGQVIWSRKIGGTVRATPSIDPATNTLFVGNRLYRNGLPAPSTIFAIDLVDGHIKWEHGLNGVTHGSPVIANGVVYMGTSGGDPPACINGGVNAFDEASGAVRWIWHVNSRLLSRGGGSVWGAIAYDGANLFFGTGNTCDTPVMTADGAVELTTSGKVVWSFVAKQDSEMDDDSGGGVLLSGGKAIFINKDGTLYALSQGSGQESWATSLNSNEGFGGFATPSTDGSTIVVGAGTFSTNGATQVTAAGAYCPIVSKPQSVISGTTARLVAVDQGGVVLWSKTIRNRLVGYAAIVNGMAFAPVDRNLAALDLKTGNVLWSYPISAYFQASAVVVKSGVYAADTAGNVYAFSISTEH
jgi:outer membrane protein assembly factor BamB